MSPIKFVDNYLYNNKLDEIFIFLSCSKKNIIKLLWNMNNNISIFAMSFLFGFCLMDLAKFSEAARDK